LTQLYRQKLTTREFSAQGRIKGTLRDTLIEGRFGSATVNKYQARSYPTQVRTIDTYLYSKTSQKPLGTTTTGVGLRPTRLKISKTGEVSRENLRSQVISLESGKIRQDILFTPDPAQKTTSIAGVDATFRVRPQTRGVSTLKTAGTRAIVYSRAMGKRAQVGLTTQRTKVVTQRVTPAKLPKPKTLEAIKIPKLQSVRKTTPRTAFSTRASLTSASLSTRSAISQSRIQSFAITPIQKTISTIRQSQTPITNTIQSQLVSTQGTYQVAQTTSILGQNTIIPITNRVSTPNPPSPIPVPKFFGSPKLNFGGTPFGRRQKRDTYSKKGYTRSLAGVGAKKRRKATLFDIGSGLTVRF
jgi:hypothetical protein